MTKEKIATIILLYLLVVVMLTFFAYEHGKSVGKIERMREEIEKEDNGQLYNKPDNNFAIRK